MEILIVSQCYYPDDFRINDISRQLAADGHTVHVLTGLPDYATGRVPQAYRRHRRRRETIDGVDVIRVPVIARRQGMIFRALNYLSFVVSGCLWARFCRVKADAVFSYETSPVLQVRPAITFHRRRKVPLVIHCCDIWPACLKVWGVKESSLLYRFMTGESRRIFGAGDRVAISSAPFRAYLRTVNGVADGKIVELPQHAEDLYADIAGTYEENGCTDFLFAGNVGSAQNVGCLVEAADALRRLTDKPFHVHIVGDGSARAACETLARERRLEDWVTFHGKHPLAEMSRFYRLADCFVLTMQGGEVGEFTLPAKWQGYISAGKPVLAAASGICAEMTALAGCGESVPAGDGAALAEAMCRVMDDPEEYRARGLAGRRYYEENYTKERFMSRLYAILEEVLSSETGKR